MDYKHILYAEADGVAVITVNRPDKLNALDGAVMFELCDAAFRVQNSAAVRVAVLTGAENPALAEKAQEKGVLVLNACTLVLLRTGQF